jgi:hypothetical protein
MRREFECAAQQMEKLRVAYTVIGPTQSTVDREGDGLLRQTRLDVEMVLLVGAPSP